MAAHLRFIISAAALCVVCFSVRAGGREGADAPGSAGIAGEVLSYIDNIEYSAGYRTGETLFGASAVVRFFYEYSGRWQFAAGVSGLRRFGDTRFFSRALPVFRARYVSESLSFILGELVSADAHRLPDMLYRHEYRYDPGIEEGIQILARSGRVRGDLWVSWDSLNTRERREHFNAGFSSQLSFNHFMFPLYIIADHSGGERYDVPGEPVQEHLGGVAGCVVTYPLGSVLRRAFGQVLAAGSAYRVRSGGGETGSGRGIMCKIGISPFGVDCSAQWFRGRDLWVPSGDPLYRSGKPVYALEASGKISVSGNVSMSGGVRFETEARSFRSYFENPGYRWWVSLGSGYERRFGEKR